jgi:hypothetical protein
LLQSTIKAYFEGRKELFEGLAMAELEEDWESYPVFHIDLSAEDYKQGVHVLDNKLDSLLEDIENENSVKTDKPSQSLRFAELIKQVYETTGKQVVILIDEYDKPLMDAMDMGKELYDEFHSRLAAFYATLKSSDPYIRFSLLTGITKFAQLNIFSGLNQLDDITLNEYYASICGITQEELEANFKPEIERFAQKRSLSYDETLQKLKEQYNGFRFTKAEVTVYNPFSTIRVLKEGDFHDFWFETGTPTFLIKEVQRIKFDISNFDDKVIAPTSNITNYRAGTNDIVPLLFQSGYLTIKGTDFLGDYILGFPNNEVKNGFVNYLISYFTASTEDGEVIGLNGNQLVRDLHSYNLENFFDKLTSLYASIPYDIHDKTEKHFHSLFYMAITAIGQYVHAEKHSSQGAADAIIETANYIYIFEFKIKGNGTAQSAIDQINNTGYATKYEKDPDEKRKIVKLGVVFDKETKTIAEWLEG